MTARGWTETENEMLLKNVEERRSRGGSLSEAFRMTAENTGRMPNSVRNHYYSLLGAESEARSRCVPFTDDEANELMNRMLELISRGSSVRGAALTLANGDAGLMLRYQNKFRSMRQKTPELFGIAQMPKGRSSRASEAECIIKEKNRELKLQHERFVTLHAMFTRLCELNRELAKQLAEENAE